MKRFLIIYNFSEGLEKEVVILIKLLKVFRKRLPYYVI